MRTNNFKKGNSMSQGNTAADSLPKCGCGRSLHMPHCDGSHGRSEQQYAQWKLQTELEQQALKTK
jgi:CDGSH-type Zn-finger protein